jgi:hypothetical protein
LKFLVADVDLFMKKLLHSATFLFACATLFAQNVSDLPANSFPFNMSGTTVKAFDNRYEGIKGTHMFLEDFKRGSVLLRTTLYKKVLLNYDAVNDLVLIQRDLKTDAFELRKDMVSEFTLSDNGEVFHFVRLVKDSNPSYFLELLNGKTSIYCKSIKILQRTEIGGAYNNSDNTSDQFKMQNSFFTLKDGELVEFTLSKKGLTKFFPEKEKQITAALKGKKIDSTNFSELRVLFAEILTD